MTNNPDWNTAISCSDMDRSYGESEDSLKQYLAYLQSPQESLLVGGSGASGMIGCANWPIVAKWRYPGKNERSLVRLALSWLTGIHTGPFTATTKTPMQFLGSTFDPATPIENAQANLGRFNGSKLITVDGLGVSFI